MTRTFLDRLFAGCDNGVVELRALPSKPVRRAWATLGDWTALGPFVTAEVREQRNVYVGIATRRDQSSDTTENLSQLGVLWVDFDLTPNVVRERLAGFPFPPALLVESGLGAHVYWRAREVLDLHEPATIARVASLLRRLTA
jgi:hypothetical protein